MSALGQKRTLERLHPMSALPPKADIGTAPRAARSNSSHEACHRVTRAWGGEADRGRSSWTALAPAAPLPAARKPPLLTPKDSRESFCLQNKVFVC